MTERRHTKTRRTKKASVEESSNGTKYYGPYDKGNGRKITVVRKPDGSTTSTHTARHEKNKEREREGKKPLPKGSPGKGQQVAHKGHERTSSSSSGTRVESAKKNIGDGNKSRRKKRG